MPTVNAGTIGGMGSLLGGLKQMIAEDNGQGSSMRLMGYSIAALIVEDVAVRGNPLTWFHVVMFASWVSAKAIQKFAEKPAQGVVNQKALEYLINDAVKKVGSVPTTPGGTNE